jgi:hypothetical protein
MRTVRGKSCIVLGRKSLMATSEPGGESPTVRSKASSGDPDARQKSTRGKSEEEVNRI